MKGVINFGVDENGKFFFESMTSRYLTEVEPTELEAEALNLICSALDTSVKLYRRSDAYLTICNEEGNDFCRLKVSERAKWFSLDMDKSMFREDQRLECVQNKNQRHWKIKLKGVEDISLYSDIIKESANR